MKKHFKILVITLSVFGLLFFGCAKKTEAQIDPGLIAYWSFDDESEVNAGLISDKIGNYSGQNISGTWSNDGYSGGAISNNCIAGNVDQCGMSVKGIPSVSNFTLLFRAKSNGENDSKALVWSQGFFVRITDPNNIIVLGDGMTGGSNGFTATINNLNNWNHFAFVHNDNGYYLYINGVLNKFEAASPRNLNLQQFIFGNGNIQMDDIRFYNIELTALQIQQELNYKTSCIADNWSCGDWGNCTLQGTQLRNCNIINDCPGIETPSPVITQSCTYVPSCSLSDWSCDNWSSCSSNNSQTRTCNKTSNCQGGVQSPTGTQSCTYTSSCVSFTYSSWSGCSADGKQTRSVISKYPANCEGGESPKETLSCIPTPPTIDPGATNRCDQITKNIKYWMDLDLSTINPEGLPFSPSQISSMWESRHKTVVAALKSLLDLTKSYQCGSETKCTQDTWQCGSWGTCSPQGIQTRDCSKTFDCSTTETASPATSQYCVAPNQPKQLTPTDDLAITNQDSIIKSTVKLVCPVNSTTGSQGSGTIIDSKGIILTNKHVIEGTQGCLVGFINSYSDEPYFGERQIADIYKVSSDSDIAILKIRNTSNVNIPFINISNNNSNLLGLGDKITTYGYPAKFGTKITYTSGDFSGIDGNYLKTTAIIEHGNSGGGAYLKDGTFIGIPTAVIKGSLNSMGYLLSVNKVNSWINGSSYASNSGNSNNYSRVSSILENIDLNTLNSLNLYVASNEAENKKQTNSEKKLSTFVDKNLSKKMSGKILLQVENRGEAYYVNPKTLEKYYMANGNEAYNVMRNLGVGITNKNLEKIKTSKSFAKSNSGKIFLQVEAKGEAYYIDFNGAAHYLKNGPAAYEIMRSLGLGITNDNLNKISTGVK